ncbi:ribonuclease H-like domain-containing protein [Suillus subalutaceus]|uniref:ribonuclease H-like domain-containing protein n=1 Tax=Suillus subalutaceus TaxID=48586 RepID=UPI001B868A12|nr:ribonuclease H-like domain-containing protein [Suillus subalutaceus]KAG1837574.1 ribonuclease H-like domain-containing protein [Suillus subalutaceus]
MEEEALVRGAGMAGGSRGGVPGDLIFRGPASVDQRLATLDQLVTSFNKLTFNPERPHRPGFGTLGYPITLRANFFPVKLPKGPIYDYHLEITPSTDIKRIRAQGWKEFLPQKLVSNKRLPQPLDVQVQYYEDGEAGPNARSKTYTFAIIHTADLDVTRLTKYLSGDIESRDYEVQPLVAAVNLVLQTHAARTGVRVGKNRYFFPSQERFELALGIDAVKGFFTSARPAYNELMVNVGVCMTAFYKPGNLADAIRFTQKLKVTTRHLGYKQKKPIKKIMSTSARRTFFHCEEYHGKISYPHITLRHADDLPVVDISETSNMIRFACNPPKVNADAIIERGLPTLGFTPETLGSPLSGFGIAVDNNMAVIPGRELPRLVSATEGGGRLTSTTAVGTLLTSKFHNGGAIKSWWVLVVREKDGRSVFSGADDPILTDLWRGFGEKCRNSGISLGSQPVKLAQSLIPRADDPGRQQALDSIQENPSFILAIKRICDVEVGVHTIHMLTDKVVGKDANKQDQYFSNVALKLNTKLGGINHVLDSDSLKWLTKAKTMVVGMDVTHPGPGSVEGTPSIAAVVASIDSSFVQFPASLRCQETKKEMITDLTSMMIDRLMFYAEKNQPCRIDPLLTIIICGKRHHAKFWPTDSQFADRNGITAVFDFDFYLQAHAGLQGHVKATHYTVVYDENRLGANELQQGTHTASYLYARATKAVSLVPAAYYADLACERGRCLLERLLER